MADSPQPELTVPKPDAGVAFRLEMWATNALLGYWWVIVGAIALLLGGVAVYGFVDSMYSQGQRTASARTEAVLAAVEKELLDPDRVAMFEEQTYADGQRRRIRDLMLTPSYDGFEPPSTVQLPIGLAVQDASTLQVFGFQVFEPLVKDGVDKAKVLNEGGDALMAVYTGNSGVAAHQAALYAGSLYRLADNTDGARKAFEAAAGSTREAQKFSAENALFWLDVKAGDLDAADARMRPWIDEKNGWFGQQAAYDLGRALQASDRTGDAEAVYRELLNTWTVTPYRDLVDARLEQMGVDTVPMPTEPAEGAGEGEGATPPAEGEGSE